MRPTAAFLSDNPETLERVYGPEARTRLEDLTDLLPGSFGTAELARPGAQLARLEVAFSTWGMPALDADCLDFLPNLKAVFYAAGSVRAFAGPLLERGVAVFSAAEANARPTAEFALAQILLAGKRALPSAAALRREGAAAWGPPPDVRGNRGAEVALLGAGRVGRKLLELLRPFELKALVFDPLTPKEAVEALGAEKVSLKEAFIRAQVVSNHLADVPGTRGLVTEGLLRSMRYRATFINTGRGATVDEAGLWAALRARKDLFAALDVLETEPPAADCPGLRMDNVFLTPHVAGSLGEEWHRLSGDMIQAFEEWHAGRASRHRISRDMLDTMA